MSNVLTVKDIDEELEDAIALAISRGESLNIQQIKAYATAINEAEGTEKHQVGQILAAATKRRGRPPKERAPEFKYKMASGDCTLADTDTWAKKISNAVAGALPELTEVQRMTLVPRLVHAAGHYNYPRKTGLRTIQTSKTNKLHAEKPVLIYECAKALEDITGEALTVWQAENRNGLQEPKGVKLARIVATAVGRPLVGDIRRHAAKAREMLDKE